MIRDIDGNQDSPLQRVRPEVKESNSELAKKDYIGILRRFEFEAKLQRMSIIAKNYLDDQCPYQFFVKGSPEKIKELSVASSLPADFDTILNEYTEHGYRVIALAHKVAPQGASYEQLMTLPREDVGKELTFLGFLIMQNKLKSATIKALAELNEADIRTIMATGDNMLTAISVGRKCGIVQEE